MLPEHDCRGNRSETIARNGDAAAEAAACAGPRVFVTSRPWESQLLAPRPETGALLNVNGDPTPLLNQLAAAGVTRIVFVARGDLKFACERPDRPHAGALSRLARSPAVRARRVTMTTLNRGVGYVTPPGDFTA